MFCFINCQELAARSAGIQAIFSSFINNFVAKSVSRQCLYLPASSVTAGGG